MLTPDYIILTGISLFHQSFLPMEISTGRRILRIMTFITDVSNASQNPSLSTQNQQSMMQIIDRVSVFSLLAIKQKEGPSVMINTVMEVHRNGSRILF